MDEWLIVGLTLLAVLVGVAVPALVQLFITLRAARASLDRLGPRIDMTLSEVREVTRRINRATQGLDVDVKRARVLFETLGDLSDSLQSLRGSLRAAAALGGAVGPAITAALRALAETDDADAPPKDAPPEGRDPAKRQDAGTVTSAESVGDQK